MEAFSDTHTPKELLEHAGWLQALARRLVRDPGAADDLVQETWVAALGGSRARGETTRAWLATVLRNFLRQRVRSEDQPPPPGARRVPARVAAVLR